LYISSLESLSLQVLQKDVKIEVKFESAVDGGDWRLLKLRDLVQCPGASDTLKSLIGYGSLVRYWDVGWFSSESVQRPVDYVSEVENLPH
jgi:hypothetical protein